MKNKNAAALAAIPILTAAAVFSGCTNSFNNTDLETGIVSESVTEAETASPYLLVRGWEGRELLDSLFFCGKNRPLPFALEDEPDLILSEDILIFPDGSYAEASVSSENIDGAENPRITVTALRFKRESAPADFSLYGVDFSTKPNDITESVGIANNVYDDGKNLLTHSFYEGGITELTFVFSENVLSEIYIAA